MKKNRILFGISSLWLGHATRTLVIIKYFLEKWYNIDIISYWNALNFLKSELKNTNTWFIELVDYPLLERWNGIIFYFYLIIDLFSTKRIIKKENKFIKNRAKNYDYIISDGRYWIYSKFVPSFLISHQLSFIMPKWLWIFQRVSDKQNMAYFKNFTKVLIPDYEDKNNNLAWLLSHPNWISKINHNYIWNLSSFFSLDGWINIKERSNYEASIDFLFTISWYLLDNKDAFVNKLINESKNLKWNKVFILGDTKNNYIKKLENNITIYSSVWWDIRQKLFKNAEIIISRAGYTTIMDLVELDKKAILYPTPHQTEQEYLANYLKNKNYFVIWKDSDNLVDLVNQTKNLQKINFKEKTQETLKKLDKYFI